MSNYTPRSDIKHGDQVKLTGADWKLNDIQGEERTVYGSGFEAHIQDRGEKWYIFDPVQHHNGSWADWSVTLVEAAE